MAIHHATLKRAADLGIKLLQDEEMLSAQFTLGTKTVDITFSDETAPKDAVNDIEAFRILHAEHGVMIANGEDSQFFGYLKDERSELHDSLLDAAQAFLEGERSEDEMVDQDGEQEQEEEEPEAGAASVVKHKYRVRYAENDSKGASCWDDFAKLLHSYLNDEDGKLNVERTLELCDANDINGRKYLNRNRGWEGRLRMTISNILRAKLRKEGFKMVWPGRELAQETTEQPEGEAEGETTDGAEMPAQEVPASTEQPEA